MAYDSFKMTIGNSYNSIIKEDFLTSKKNQIEYLYDRSIDREDNCLLNGKEFKMSPRIFDTKLKAQYYQTLKAVTVDKNDYIKSGDLLFCKKDYWLCTSSYDYHDLYCHAEFIRTNYTLKWQNSKGEIIEKRSYIVSAAQYDSGEITTNTMVLGSDQLLITLPCDEDTVYLNNTQRFLIDKNTVTPTAYKISRVDTVPYSDWEVGCIVLIATQTTLNPLTDRVDLMVCDYKEDENSGSTITSVIPSIEYTTTQIKSGGSAKKFVAKFKDADGNDVTPITFAWDIVCSFKDKLVTTENDNYIKISVDDNSLIGEEFELTLTADGNTTSITIDIIEYY